MELELKQKGDGCNLFCILGTVTFTLPFLNAIIYGLVVGK